MPNEDSAKALAGICGLYCGACAWYIGTTEEPERLAQLAAIRGYAVEDSRCYGCGSGRRNAHCASCQIAACATERGLESCGECRDYPCAVLREFQAALPHRLELWQNLERIRAVGCAEWLAEVRQRYACPSCGTVNSAYDLKCRRCGQAPSCAFVADHRQTIVEFLDMG